MQKKDDKVGNKTANKEGKEGEKESERVRSKYIRKKIWLLQMREKQKMLFNYVRLAENTENSKNKPRGLYFSKAVFEGLILLGAYIRRSLCTEGNLRFKINWASL